MANNNHEPKVQLHDLLKQFDIPEFRKDAFRAANLTWLFKNMAVRNSAHPEFERAWLLLVDVMKDMDIIKTSDWRAARKSVSIEEGHVDGTNSH